MIAHLAIVAQDPDGRVHLTLLRESDAIPSDARVVRVWSAPGTLSPIEGAIAPVKVCANCGRQFDIQVGRAQRGQYRQSGVQCCSAKCTNALKSREYRQRQRALRSEL